MRRSIALILWMFSSAVFAQDEMLISEMLISVNSAADFVAPGDISTNIVAECGLPEKQMADVIAQLQAAHYTVNSAVNTPPETGLYLKVEIRNAVSVGNAFIGHRKSVTSRAALFKNGAEIGSTTFTRDSMGGVFAGFKGSCTVLHRCTETLAKDIVGWIRGKTS